MITRSQTAKLDAPVPPVHYAVAVTAYKLRVCIPQKEISDLGERQLQFHRELNIALIERTRFLGTHVGIIITYEKHYGKRTVELKACGVTIPANRTVEFEVTTSQQYTSIVYDLYAIVNSQIKKYHNEYSQTTEEEYAYA